MITLGSQSIKYGSFGISYNIFLSRRGKLFLEFCRDNAITLGYSANSIDLMCRELEPILDKMDVVYYESHNPQFGTVNIVNPTTFRATPHGGLLWSNDGVNGNSANGYIDTNFDQSLLIEGQKYQRLDASRFFVTVLRQGGTLMDGLSANGNNCFYSRNDIANNRINNAGSYTPSYSLPYTTGFTAIIRRDASEISFISKDTEEFRQREAGVISSGTQTIFRKYNGVDNIEWGGCKISLYGIGASMTFNESQLFRTSFNKLLTYNGHPAIA